MRKFAISFLFLLSHFAFAQTLAPAPVNVDRNGNPATGLVTICATNPGSGTCTSLVTTYTDATLSQACIGTGEALSGQPSWRPPGVACSNPGNADADGNVIVFAHPGNYWCQYNSTGIAHSLPCSTGGAGGGGGSPGGSPFSVQTNVGGISFGGTSLNVGQILKGTSAAPIAQLTPVYDARDYTSCGVSDDTAALSSLLSTIGSASAGISLSCQLKLSNITIPANVTIDPSSGGSILMVAGQTLTILGPIIPVARQIFYNAVPLPIGAPTLTPVASDNFTRADENPLSDGGNWLTPPYAAGPLQVLGNLAQATAALAPGSSTQDINLWSPNNSFNNAQYSSVTIPTLGCTSCGVVAIVRANTSVLTYYYAQFVGPLSGNPNTAVYLGKNVAGVGTSFLSNRNIGNEAPGTVFTLGVEGSTLFVYAGGVLKYTYTDPQASITSGRPGIDIYTSSIPDAQISNWEGGNFVSGIVNGTISFAGNKVVREFYPEWWGAVKDGVANDLLPLQAATDAVRLAGGGSAGGGGGWLVLGAGTYNIGSGQWQISSNIDQNNISVRGAGILSTTIVSSNPTTSAIYLQHDKYVHLQGFALNQVGTPKTGIGIAMGGPGGGTQTDGCVLEDISISNFNWGINTEGTNGGTSSEITYINLVLANNTNGFRSADSNSLNHTFINLQISSNTIGVNATTTGVNVFGGAASANGDDFIFNGNNNRTVTAFRSETVVNTFVTLTSGDLSITNCLVTGLANTDTHNAIVFNGGRLGIHESWIAGQISMGPAQTRQTDGNEITIEDSTIFDGNNTYSYTSQPAGMGPGFRFSTGLNAGGRFASRNNFHYGAGNVNLGQWPSGEGYIMSSQGSTATFAYIQYKSIGGVLTPGAGTGTPANTIQPTAYIHHIGAGLVKTIDAAGGQAGLGGGVLPFRCFQAIADAAYTTDTSDNVSLALTAVVGQKIEWCYDLVTTKWYPSNIFNPTAPGDIGGGTAAAGTFTTVTATGSINFSTMLITAALPTIAANGCGGAAAAIVSANSTAAFDIDVGTTPTSAGCTVTMPTASDDWHCWVSDYTTITATVFMQRQTAGSTNSITLANYNSGVSKAAPVAHDIYHVICMAH